MLGKQKLTVEQAFGPVLRELRLKAGLSQERLAFEADLQRNYISLLELGRNQPTLTTLFKLCKALGVSPVEVVGVVHASLERKR